MADDDVGRRLDLRLIPIALGAWLGAGVGVGVEPRVGLQVCAVAAVVTVAGPLLARGTHPGATPRVAAVAALVGLAGAGLLVGVGSGAAQSGIRGSGVIGPLVEDRATVVATITVRAPPQRARTPGSDGMERWLVRVRATSVTGRGSEGTSRATLLVIGGPAWQQVRPGEQLRVRGRLEGTEPGDAVVAVLRPSAAPVQVAAPGRADRVLTRVRERFREACRVLPEEPGGLLPGLVIGDTSALPPDLATAMRTTGLTHLTAVSGANITIVCGAVLLVLTAAGVRLLPRLAAASVAMLAFVAVAGAEPSVLRAAAMGAVGLLAVARARPGAGIPPLCLAVLGLVVVDPWLSRAAGFAMSVLATGGLVLLARPVAAELEAMLPRWLALAVAVPISAQVAVAPVSVLLTPALPVYTVPANLLVAPAIAPATVLGAVAAALAPVAMPLAQALVWLAGWPLRWVVWVATVFGGLPGASLPWPEGPRGAVLVALASAAGLVAGRAVLRHVGAAAGGRVRLLAGVLVPTVLLWLWWPTARSWVTGWPSADWQVVACSVGQGTAVAVRSGPGAAVLLDAGPDPAAVDGCLGRLGVHTLDLVVLSHFHADHVDGLTGALRGRQVGPVLVTGLAEPADRAARVSEDLAAAGLTPTVAGRGWAGSAGDVRWRLLGPRDPPADGATRSEPAQAGEGAAANDASLIVHLRTPALTVLSLGDAEDDGQRQVLRMLRSEGPAPVDVVVVAHHGSATQVPALYETAAPRVALISVGADNDYGHPAASTRRLLSGLGAVTLRTDECGDAMVRADLRSVCRAG